MFDESGVALTLLSHRPQMKNSVVGAVFLATLLTASTGWASAFTVLDVHLEIAGLLFGTPEDLGVGVNQYFDLRSSNPLLFYRMENTTAPGQYGTYSFAESLASASFVSVAIDQPGTAPSAEAEAISTVLFRPNFDGNAPQILFYGDGPSEAWDGLRPTASWTVTDVTSSRIIALNIGERGAFSQPLYYTPDNSNCGLVPSDCPDYSWDSTHVYELKMDVQTGSNHSTDSGYISTNLFSVDVPEPSTVLLFAFGCLGLVLLFPSIPNSARSVR